MWGLGLRHAECVTSNSILANYMEKFKSVSKLISALEDLDDVQDVYANFDIEEKELEALLSE